MKLGKLISAAMRPSLWSTLAHGVAPSFDHLQPLDKINPAAIIDVGANKGQFSAFAHWRWPDASIYAFEPIPSQADIYDRVMKGESTLYRHALGHERGELTLHMASQPDSSSLLPLGHLQKSLFDMTETAQLSVSVERLDGVLELDTIAMPALLKIDVQGFEYEVIDGITGLCDVIRWVYVETSFVELYEGQKLYGDVAGLLTKMGYIECQRHNLYRDESGNEVQADILFERIDQ